MRQFTERFVITLFAISMDTEVRASVPSDEVAEPPPPNDPLIGGGGAGVGIGWGDGVLGLSEPPQANPTIQTRLNRQRPLTDRKPITVVVGR